MSASAAASATPAISQINAVTSPSNHKSDTEADALAERPRSAEDTPGPATARLLAAEVAGTDGDTFVVQVFVDMLSKSKQTPDGVAATATYRVTMHRASDWTITDVGGVGAGLPGTGGSEAAPGSGGR
ncbi:hypothetical protein [Rhodococcus zopfii]|uniref:hypothetical protein n=1 Tax=Rhodococcus zopfii TaxID=43772 RepID=UPI00157DC47E|nr:hypothetical protein [Rhodococcus zopfii]